MDTLFTVLKKGLVATIFLMFALVSTYIPQDWNQVELAHAGGVTGGYSAPQGALALVEQTGVNIATTASAGFDAITSYATETLFTKEFWLDGIAWAIAKSIVSSMVSDLITWINSGFEGSPAFVQDLSGFLRNAADIGVGNLIEKELGTFICSPFLLDVQISVSLQYQRSRVDQTAPTCTLTGVIDNIEGFLDGGVGSFTENGGWDDWIDITSNPMTYTPYGAVLSAQEAVEIRALNTEGEESAQLGFGAGFLSGKVCEPVIGPDGPNEECFISKPGKVIQEALTFNLDSGRQALITADEIDELIGALIGGLANEAITGAAGLLGLSGGTGHTYSGYDGGSYLSQLETESAAIVDTSETLVNMQEALNTQKDYNELANDYIPLLEAYADNILLHSYDNRLDAADAAKDARAIVTNTNADITTLNTLIAEFNNNATTDARKLEIAQDFGSLSLYVPTNISYSQSSWDAILKR